MGSKAPAATLHRPGDIGPLADGQASEPCGLGFCQQWRGLPRVVDRPVEQYIPEGKKDVGRFGAGDLLDGGQFQGLRMAPEPLEPEEPAGDQVATPGRMLLRQRQRARKKTLCKLMLVIDRSILADLIAQIGIVRMLGQVSLEQAAIAPALGGERRG